MIGGNQFGCLVDESDSEDEVLSSRRVLEENMLDDSMVMIRNNPPATVQATCRMLRKIVRNIVKDPVNEQFLRLSTGNKKIKESILDVNGGSEFLDALGFRAQDGGTVLVLREDPLAISYASDCLQSLTNEPHIVSESSLKAFQAAQQLARNERRQRTSLRQINLANQAWQDFAVTECKHQPSQAKRANFGAHGIVLIPKANQGMRRGAWDRAEDKLGNWMLLGGEANGWEPEEPPKAHIWGEMQLPSAVTTGRRFEIISYDEEGNRMTNLPINMAPYRIGYKHTFLGGSRLADGSHDPTGKFHLDPPQAHLQ